MPSAPAVGLILAAGRGVRMEPFSARYPKPLLPVLGRPVIAHHLELLRSVGIEDVVVVVGHLGTEIAAALGDGAAHGMRLRYVEQAEPLGIAHAVGVAEPHVDRPFLLLLGDVFFVPRGLSRMFRLLEEGLRGVIAVREEPDLEAIRRNFAVLLDDGGRVRRVLEKPRHPPTRLKGTGVYLFDLPFFDAIRRTPRSALRDEYEITDAIQIFIDDGYEVGAADVIAADVNLTVPRDVWELNLRELARAGLERVVAPDASVDPGARIERSVVGAGAFVGAVRVEDCVVLPGTRVEHDARRCVVTPEGRVAFEEEP